MLGIYCRISREKEEGKNVSIPDQKKKGIAKAKELGLEYEIYVDEGISGTLSVSERPSFSKLLEDITEDKITHLYAVDQSRIERSPETRIVVNTMLKQKGIRMFTEMEGEIDLHDPQQSMVGDIMSAFNKFFVDITTKKVKSALLHRVEEGKAHSSILPYGYTKDKDGYLIIDEEEAEIVKKIYDMSLKGTGTRSIAQWLNDHNIPTRYNKIGKGTITVKNKYTGERTTRDKKDVEWSGNSARGIIVNTLYKGERVYKGKSYKAPAIVTEKYWQEVNDNLKKNARTKTGNKPKYDYLLKGVLRCGRCGRNYYGRIKKDRGERFYMCSSKRVKGMSCGQRSINIDVLENLIWTQIFLEPDNLEKIFQDAFKKKNTDKPSLLEDKKIYEGRINDLEKQKKRAVQAFMKGAISEEDIQPEINSLKNEIAKYKKKLDDVNEKLKNLDLEEKEIEDIHDLMAEVTTAQTFQEKRDLLNALIKNIVLHYRESDGAWLIELEYLTGDTFPIVLDKEGYKMWLKMKPLKERYKGDIEISEEDLKYFIQVNEEESKDFEMWKQRMEDKKKGGGGGANSAPNKGGKKSNTTSTSSKTAISKWFTNTNATDVALVGGGAYPQPGEISLSHNGVLFLDELPEFKRGVLEVMRQPLEDREVTISRAKFTVTYPSSFMLVASMNPSPSGFFNDPGSPSTSSPAEMQRYLSKISGPLLDRIDIHIEVTPVPFEKLSEERKGESSVEIRKRVTKAREHQTKRFEEYDNVHYNAQMTVRQIRKYCVLEESSKQLLKVAMEKLNLSARAYDRILKVARTIADLEGSENIKGAHISEAIQYRSLDRDGWLG